MKVAIAQLNYTIGDFETNKLKIIEAIERSKSQGVDLVVFAEEAISGAPAYDLLNKVNFLELCEETLVEIAACCDNIAVLVGLPVQNGASKTVSAAAFIKNRKIIGYITRKYVVQRDDATYLWGGEGSAMVEVNGRRVAVVVGEDVMHPAEFTGRDADVVVNLGSTKYARQRIEKRYDYFSGLAFRLGVHFIMVNQIGGNTDVIYDGSSAAFDRKGRPIALLASFDEDYRIIDLDRENAPVEVPYQDKTRNVYKALRLGLRDFLRKNPAQVQLKGATVGLMNPPYSQGTKADPEQYELSFIEHLLDSLTVGARAAVIVPQSSMTGKSKAEQVFKASIMKKHTLEGVITCNTDTFYGVGTNPVIAVFTAHEPHDADKVCKFIDFRDDGYEVRAHVGLVEGDSAKDKKQHLLDVWLDRAEAPSKFCVESTVKPEDEWLHSFYYFNDEIPMDADFEKAIGDYLTFEFSMVMQNREYLFKGGDGVAES